MSSGWGDWWETQVWRSRDIASTLAVGVASGARCHMMARTAHVEKGQARGGAYTWIVHCGRARRNRDACSVPRTRSATTIRTMELQVEILHAEFCCEKLMSLSAVAHLCVCFALSGFYISPLWHLPWSLQLCLCAPAA